MYGKLFSSMYDGTLYGQWQAIVTLQQMVILADEDGIVDITPPALAAKTSIPLEIIEKGLEQLAAPDRYSRSEVEQGRRIILIDESRPWGWSIVNYRYYRNLASREDKKRKDRERVAEKRSQSEPVATCRKVSQGVADVAHTDTDTDTELMGASSDAPRPQRPKAKSTPYEAVMDAYNRLCPSMKTCRALNDKRKRRIKKLTDTLMPTLAHWEAYFADCEDTDKYTGRVPPRPPYDEPFRGWFDFILRDDTVTAVLER